MSRTKGKNDPLRIQRDSYETPQWCVDIIANKLVQRVNTTPFERIIDLGAGDGRIGETVRTKFMTIRGRVKPPKLIFLDIEPPNEKIKKQEWLICDYMNLSPKNLIKGPYLPTLFISNPPYSLADEFVMKTVEALGSASPGSIAIFLLRLNWLGSKKRSLWINEHSPTRITVLATRPSFCIRETVLEDGTVRKSSTDACEYGWLFWENSRAPGPFVEVGIRK